MTRKLICLLAFLTVCLWDVSAGVCIQRQDGSCIVEEESEAGRPIVLNIQVEPYPADDLQDILVVQGDVDGEPFAYARLTNRGEFYWVGDTSTAPGIAKLPYPMAFSAVRCGVIAMNPPSISASSTGTVSAVVGASNPTANAVCTCTPRTDFDDDLTPKSCVVTTGGTLVLRLYNNNAISAIDAGSQTVDWCCFEK